MRKLVAIVVLVIGTVAFPAAALAASPDNPSCWGAATRDFAQSATGAMGQHASSFDSPRLGIGNVAFLFTDTHQPGDLAAALGFTC
jgi:hypothetical protein